MARKADSTDQVPEVPAQPDAGADSAMLNLVTSQTPWWAVSLLFHVLVIALVGLASIQLVEKADEMGVIEIPWLRPVNTAAAEPPRERPEAALDDLDKDTQSKITYPQEIMADIEKHFETVNPDKPDTHDAFGNPKSTYFYDRYGIDEDPGGGKGLYELCATIGVGSNSGSFGNGDGTGIGNAIGPGRGSFGKRNGGGRNFMAGRYGPETLPKVNLALQWLAYHQEPDGHWDGIKYGASAERNDTAVTSLALLAFLGYGNSEIGGDYRKNVRDAVAWLKSRQGPNGELFDATVQTGKRGYHVAIATQALAEAAAMGGSPSTLAAAQKAINYCTDVFQQGAGGGERLGWRYEAGKDSDISVTGWFIMALKSAQAAGLKVNPLAVRGALSFLDKMERKEGGDTGYAPASKYAYSDRYESISHRTSCIGTLCRLFMGTRREELQASVDGFVAKGGVPVWGADGETVDLYYWYYGSLCCFQQGGAVFDRWNAGMKKALLENQVLKGDDAGSWNVKGEYSEYWGRVGQTALSALCLEVYYRYERLFKR